MEFILPFPPSVNVKYTISRGKRHKDKQVIDWEDKASTSLNKQNIIPFAGRCFIIYELSHPDGRIRDAANYEKSTTDFLVAKGVLPGDDRRYIKGIISYWNDELEGYVKVKIISENQFNLDFLPQ